MNKRMLFGVLASLVISGMLLAGSSQDSPPSAQASGAVKPPEQMIILDANYDDSWVANIPEFIGGFKVLHVATPKDTACSVIPNITLQTAQTSVAGHLEQTDVMSVLRRIWAIPGVPDNVTAGFTGPSAPDRSKWLSDTAEWNEAMLASGCILFTDIEYGAVSGGRGWALFQNTDAGTYTDDNAQSVNITSPSGIGTGQNNWSVALNNVVTNGASSGNFLQNGMYFLVGYTSITWTDKAHGLAGQTYGSAVPYYSSTSYYFSLTYTSGVWQLCAGNNSNSDYYCQLSCSSTGTTIISSDNTSVWFENANNNSNWYSGFPSTMSANGAQIYRNGIGQNWSGENRLTVHNCGSGYPVSGAMGSTSLKSGGTGTWTMSGIPLVC